MNQIKEHVKVKTTKKTDKNRINFFWLTFRQLTT